MAISESKIWERWQHIGGRCECDKSAHSHGGRCERKLIFVRRDISGPGGWTIRAAASDETGGAFSIYCAECDSQTAE
jgi:hypothetical protein